MWGDSYYGHSVEPDVDSNAACYWLEELNKYQPDLKDRVQLAVKQWNNTVRDILRSETGLRLSVGDEVTQVQVRVADGLPLPLVYVLERFEMIEDLVLREKTIRDTHSGLGVVREHYEQLGFLMGGDLISEDNLGLVERWLGEAVRQLGALGFERDLSALREDVLGAYYFNSRRVSIFWASIGIIAERLDVSVEGLTVVTLAHELAHAYTHLGKDIDGVVWDTQSFSESDVHVVEGLAQFYTRAVCQKLSHRFPAALEAFEAFLPMQSEPYTHFQEWVREDEHRGELVRFSMIQSRSTEFPSNYHHFLELLERQVS